MQFKGFDHPLTGLAIPVFSIRTEQSCGIGEFLDLEKTGDWCRMVGIELIQLLPINDTGFESSPYSALSAFALHPAYMRIQAIPELSKNDTFKIELNLIKEKYDHATRVLFNDVVKAKITLLHRIYTTLQKDISKDKILLSWIDKNPWIKPFAAYSTLKAKNNYKHWKEWPSLNEPCEKDIEDFWKSHRDECLFFAWMQLRLEEQLALASKNLESKGIYLKGDIPILMNEDSVDVWYNRSYFDIRNHAGAPPDMFSMDGQNWGFPVYNWDALAKDNYSWWRARLKQADKSYHVYRIDHVLGFFRIWEIPSNERTGLLGAFDPYKNITRKQLNDAHFDDSRIKWLSHPHIHGYELTFGEETKARIKWDYLNRIENEELFNLRPEIDNEEEIISLNDTYEVKNFLLHWHKNRTLIEVAPGQYQRFWKHYETKAFNSLSPAEKSDLNALFKANEEESEKIWAKHGTELLSMMKETTGMLMCAEDLGVIPACVPKVLKKLEVFCLKIERWSREYDKNDAPFIPIKKYPKLSVCTPSVHDTTTLRGYWEEELHDNERREYCQLIGWEKPIPKEYTRDLALEVVSHNLEAASLITVLQIQDWLYLNEKMNKSIFKEDRINIPGTVNDNNWSYRIPVLMDEMISGTSFSQFNKLLKTIIEKRQKKKAAL